MALFRYPLDTNLVGPLVLPEVSTPEMSLPWWKCNTDPGAFLILMCLLIGTNFVKKITFELNTAGTSEHSDTPFNYFPTHARARARTHTHTHTHKSTNLFFFSNHQKRIYFSYFKNTKAEHSVKSK